MTTAFAILAVLALGAYFCSKQLAFGRKRQPTMVELRRRAFRRQV